MFLNVYLHNITKFGCPMFSYKEDIQFFVIFISVYVWDIRQILRCHV